MLLLSASPQVCLQQTRSLISSSRPQHQRHQPMTLTMTLTSAQLRPLITHSWLHGPQLLQLQLESMELLLQLILLLMESTDQWWLRMRPVTLGLVIILTVCVSATGICSSSSSSSSSSYSSSSSGSGSGSGSSSSRSRSRSSHLLTGIGPHRSLRPPTMRTSTSGWHNSDVVTSSQTRGVPHHHRPNSRPSMSKLPSMITKTGTLVQTCPLLCNNDFKSSAQLIRHRTS